MRSSGQVIGLLYGINTLGAASGSLFAGYILIGRFWFDGTTYMAALFNPGCGIDRNRLRSVDCHQAKPGNTKHKMAKSVLGSWSYRQILFASLLVGFIGLGFEMVWIRILYMSVIDKILILFISFHPICFPDRACPGGYFWGRRVNSSRAQKLFWQME